MPNVLGNYDPLFYANEALIQLNKALGMSGRVHRGYDKMPQERGSTININRPTSFVATDVNTSTGGTTASLNPDKVAVTLDTWKEVKFALSDKELTFTQEKIIEDHITPAAVALADAIDVSLVKLSLQVPWYASFTSGGVAVGDLTGARKVLFNNKVPMNDLHFMVDGDIEAELLTLAAFATGSTAGQAGIDTLMRGSMGTRYGMEFFANQNVLSHTSGTVTDAAGAVATETAVGDVVVSAKALTSTDAFKIGDVIKISGDAQNYVLTKDVTVAGGQTVAVFDVFPAIKKINSVDAVITIVPINGSAGVKNQNLLFHRHAFALAMAPLSNIGAMLGAKVATVSDPITNLSIRSRMWYDGEHSSIKVSLDALWGVTVLNPNLAVRAVK